MTCDELQGDYGLFAMGVLEDPERTELRAHLARGCDRCVAGVREARQFTYGIGASVEGPEPPRALRKKILAAAGVLPQPRWHWQTAWLAAAALAAVAIVAVLYQEQKKDREIAGVRLELARSAAEAVQLRAAINLLEAPETREVSFGQGPAAPPRGHVYFNPSGVLLVAANLPQPPSGKTYEMWIIPKGGAPEPAGLFASNVRGTAAHYFSAPSGVSETDTVAVTLEAAAGAAAPTSQPLIVAPL